MELRCTSCNHNLVGEREFVRFPCPSCGEVEIVRCWRCRNLGIVYRCPKCGFEGP